MISVAIMGYGTVGSGVFEVLRTNKDVIAKRVGEEIKVKYVLDLRDFPGDPVEEVLTHDFEDIVKDEDVKVVVEVMGGVEPSFTFVKRCLEAGKSVATSNKALVEAKGEELLKIAEDKKINFLYEASVGGGIPILRVLKSSLTGDVIDEISGILNGTTNYMMTKMFFEGADYDAVLKEAQANGYAERNPAADVEGHDACRKIAILSSIVTGKKVCFEDIYCEGITKISSEDMKYAKKMGTAIKLLATAKFKEDQLEAFVAPCMIYPENPLYSVNGVFNAVLVKGNMLGDSMFYGSGAGKLPTASAVVGDVIDAAMHQNESVMSTWSAEKCLPIDKGESAFRFFIRVAGSEEEMKDALAALGAAEIVKVDELPAEFGILTGEMKEKEYEEKAKAFGDQILSMIRVQ